MTEKQIKKELEHFNNLPYSLQYWCFEHFIENNIKDAEFFIEDIKAKQRKVKHYVKRKTVYFNCYYLR